MFIPKTHAKKRFNGAYCYLCARKGKKKFMFKLKSGPVEWFFCDQTHAEKWMQVKATEEGYFYYRTPPALRR